MKTLHGSAGADRKGVYGGPHITADKKSYSSVAMEIWRSIILNNPYRVEGDDLIYHPLKMSQSITSKPFQLTTSDNNCGLIIII